ncbi:saxitoxin and tetrodotoxin-binding protein 1-like [Odontesthes bonariensis]|uniref:saxitoxin and tetrodotoxin-binding protein 1-like n=1 Tax=Odontesthes bonariensis TaxID=219752 RepID=UPI003F58BFE2
MRWILVEAFSDYPAGEEYLKNTSSSLVEMKHKENNETFLFAERNIVNGKCLIFRVNMMISDPETSNHTLQLAVAGEKELDGVVSLYDDQGRADLHQSCPHCLLILYSGVFGGTPGRMLLIYRSEGKHRDADELKAAESEHRKIAECLKFSLGSNFRYDRKADFCLDKKE